MFLKVDVDQARTDVEVAPDLDRECEWLVTNGGDLQLTHVFVDGGEVTGVLDWSEGAPGDALFDLAILTLGHEEPLGDVLAGYGADVDLDVIRGWWSWRSLTAARWLIEHGFDPSSPGCEFDVLRSLTAAGELGRT